LNNSCLLKLRDDFMNHQNFPDVKGIETGHLFSEGFLSEMTEPFVPQTNSYDSKMFLISVFFYFLS